MSNFFSRLIKTIGIGCGALIEAGINFLVILATGAFLFCNGSFAERAGFVMSEVTRALNSTPGWGKYTVEVHNTILRWSEEAPWLPSAIMFAGWLFLFWTIVKSAKGRGPVRAFAQALKEAKEAAIATSYKSVSSRPVQKVMKAQGGSIARPYWKGFSKNPTEKGDTYPHAKYDENGRITIESIMAAKEEAKSQKSSHLKVVGND